MAVAFDAAAGTVSSGSATTATWTHTAGAGANMVLVWVGADTNDGTFMSMTGACTYGGSSMTLLGQINSGGSTFTTAGGVFCFGITTGLSGSNTVSFTISGNPSGEGLECGSVSFTGGATFGTAVTATVGSNTTSGSVTVPGTGSSNLIACGAANGSGTFTPTAPGVQDFYEALNSNTAAGYTGAGHLTSANGNVTFSWTQASDVYGAVGVEVQAAAVAAPPPPVVILMPSPTWKEQFKPRVKLQFPLPQPSAYLDVDYSNPAVDGGEQVAPVGLDASSSTDSGLVTSVGLSDTDSGNGANPNFEQISLSDTDASSSTDSNGPIVPLGAILILPAV